MAEVFAFVALRPCGCIAAAGSADYVERHGLDKSRLTPVSREEWLTLPWKCATCETGRKKCQTT